MIFPWAKLKKLEMAILAQAGAAVGKRRMERLRSVAGQCRNDPHAEERICYHGAMAILREADGNLDQAIRHREEEIARIRRLHRLELEKPTGGFALQNYGDEDLAQRERLLLALCARKHADLPE